MAAAKPRAQRLKHMPTLPSSFRHRAAGYGLKLMSGFHDTHLGRKGGSSKRSDAKGLSAGRVAASHG
jgi:hypothetical protein